MNAKPGWVVVAMAAMGCGSKPPPPASIGATREAGDEPRRLDDDAPLAACPPGALAALAPGWGELDDELVPVLTGCLPGRWPTGEVLVYAAAAPGPGSQREDFYPARRALLTAEGALVAEGPGDTGTYLSPSAALAATVDLDGDGVDEVLELSWEAPMFQVLRAWRVDGSWRRLGEVVTELDEGSLVCQATWTIGPRGADGARLLVVDATADGEADPYAADEGDLACLTSGAHRLRVDGDALVDLDPDDDDEDGDDDDDDGDDAP
ncbi:MAG: hypothetical protein R2939_08160 [Kofleriaceae bacterium]